MWILIYISGIERASAASGAQSGQSVASRASWHPGHTPGPSGEQVGTDNDKNNRWIGRHGCTASGERRHRECSDDESGDRRDSFWSGPPARRRKLASVGDVLGQSGVQYVIVFDGVNDIIRGHVVLHHEDRLRRFD